MDEDITPRVGETITSIREEIAAVRASFKQVLASMQGLESQLPKMFTQAFETAEDVRSRVLQSEREHEEKCSLLRATLDASVAEANSVRTKTFNRYQEMEEQREAFNAERQRFDADRMVLSDQLAESAARLNAVLEREGVVARQEEEVSRLTEELQQRKQALDTKLAALSNIS